MVIKGVEFRTGLIVIDSSGIDVILGMETLTRWGVRIDCAQRTVHLSASDGQEVTVIVQSLLDFFIRWMLDPRTVFAWCLNSRMSFRMIYQVCRLNAPLSFVLISCLAQLLFQSGPTVWHL